MGLGAVVAPGPTFPPVRDPQNLVDPVKTEPLGRRTRRNDEVTAELDLGEGDVVLNRRTTTHRSHVHHLFLIRTARARPVRRGTGFLE